MWIRTYFKAKKLDYQYTMTAILWEESNLGMYNVNVSDPSYGPWHALDRTVYIRYGCRNAWQKSRRIERLLFDYDFAFDNAIADLDFWKDYHSKSKVSGNALWARIVKSYNAGYNYRSDAAIRYLTKIAIKVKAIKVFMKQISTERSRYGDMYKSVEYDMYIMNLIEEEYSND